MQVGSKRLSQVVRVFTQQSPWERETKPRAGPRGSRRPWKSLKAECETKNANLTSVNRRDQGMNHNGSKNQLNYSLPAGRLVLLEQDQIYNTRLSAWSK
ncbi:hypothetical protein RRG08_016230 [Elysia crispata]|uniref:Uncharacterized protein n=1 Tax=Elysia crispata TaxID=231223 RepID=A0AAE0ZR69_9GAST|nr:hypothetical protein RRG08_016230 [Elysia crispata]